MVIALCLIAFFVYELNWHMVLFVLFICTKANAKFNELLKKRKKTTLFSLSGWHFPVALRACIYVCECPFIQFIFYFNFIKIMILPESVRYCELWPFMQTLSWHRCVYITARRQTIKSLKRTRGKFYCYLMKHEGYTYTRWI